MRVDIVADIKLLSELQNLQYLQLKKDTKVGDNELITCNNLKIKNKKSVMAAGLKKRR